MNTNVPSTAPRTVPCSVPLRNLTNNIWPVHEKKTIFLSNPPIRNTKVNHNIGYYSSAHANEILGYNPDSVPQAQSNNVKLTAKSLSSSRNTQQDCPMQLNRAYNLSVSPGYNLCISPGYVVRHQAQVHQTKDSAPQTKDVVVTSDRATPKVKSSNKTDTPKVTDACTDSNDDITNKLFRDLMCNKRNEAKYDEIHSVASAETLVITRNLKIDTDFDTFQEF